MDIVKNKQEMRKGQAYYQMEKSLWVNQKQQNELVHLQASFSFLY